MFNTIRALIKQGKIGSVDQLIAFCDVVGQDIRPLIKVAKVKRISSKSLAGLNATVILEG